MFYGPPVLPERAILGSLHQEGFRRLSPPVLNRDVYVLDAIDPYGDPVRVIVSAFNGRIVAAHPQRGSWQDERGGGRWGANRWGGDRWGGLPRVDPFDDEEEDEVRPVPPRAQSAKPPRQAAAPPPVKVDPPKATNPALTPRNPTIVKTSPLAIPKDKDGASGKDEKTSPVSAMPGTKVQPRVIPIAPVTAAPAPPAAAKVTAPAAVMPPPAVLDDGGASKRKETPQVPPAALE